jgi:hypothetical protein
VLVEIEEIDFVDGLDIAEASDIAAGSCVIDAGACCAGAGACAADTGACSISVVGVLYLVETGASTGAALLVATLTERGVVGMGIVEWGASEEPSRVATDLSAVAGAFVCKPAALRIASRIVKGGTF